MLSILMTSSHNHSSLSSQSQCWGLTVWARRRFSVSLRLLLPRYPRSQNQRKYLQNYNHHYLGKVAMDNIRVNAIAPGIIKTKFAEVIHHHHHHRRYHYHYYYWYWWSGIKSVFPSLWSWLLFFLFKITSLAFSSFQALTDNDDIAEKALENLPLGR